MDQHIIKFFQELDSDKSGFLSATELQRALSNGTGIPFNLRTIKLMISLFELGPSGQVDLESFAKLWQYVRDWERLFRSYDVDGSGTIDVDELSAVLSSFGYRLGQEVIDAFVRRFGQRSRLGLSDTASIRDGNSKDTILFDDFIQCCVWLRLFTEKIRKYDKDLIGVITITFEELITFMVELLI